MAALSKAVAVAVESLGEPVEHQKAEFDMFAEDDDDDMFAEPKHRQYANLKGDAPEQSKALDLSMLDDWDDLEGYYRIILGELFCQGWSTLKELIKSVYGDGDFAGAIPERPDEADARLATWRTRVGAHPVPGP